MSDNGRSQVGNQPVEADGRGVRYALRALAERDFAVFWTGAFIGNLGAWFQSLAVPFVLFLITQSGLWVGLAAAAQFLPAVLLAPIAGGLADRMDLRRTLILTQGLRTVAALLMFVGWAGGVREPVVFVLLMLLNGVGQGLAVPSLLAFVHHLAPRSKLSSAVTLNTVQGSMSRSFGPAIAGLVLLWSSPEIAFLVTTVALGAAVVSLICVRTRRDGSGTGASVPPGRALRGFIEAVRYVHHQPGVAVAFFVTALACAGAMPVFQHIVVLVEVDFQAGPLGLTLLNLALGIGTIVGVPLATGFEHRIRRSTLSGWATVGSGLAVIGFGLAPNLSVAFATLVVVGGCILLTVSMSNNTVQLIVADHIRGRVLAANVMLYSGSVAFGAWLQGLLSDVIGSRLTMIGAGIAVLAFAAVLAFSRGEYTLRRMDDPFDHSAPTTERN